MSAGRGESNKDTFLKLCQSINAGFNTDMTAPELKSLLSGAGRLNRDVRPLIGFTDRVMESLGPQQRMALAGGALVLMTVAVFIAALLGTTSVWMQVEPQPPALTLFQGNDTIWWE